MSTVGERLRIALDRAETNPRDLEAAIDKEARALRVTGYNFTTIYRAMKDEATLSVPVLDLIADELKVSRKWLRQGRGPRSAAEAQVMQPDPAEATAESLDNIWSFVDWIGEGAPTLYTMDDPAVLQALSMLIGRICDSRDLDWKVGANVRRVAAEIETAVLAALEPAGKPLTRPDVLAVLVAVENALDRR